MTELATLIDGIRTQAKRKGLVRLAREAGVPYTTVKSFHDRGWSHKNLEVIEKLAAASARLAEEPNDATTPSTQGAAA